MRNFQTDDKNFEIGERVKYLRPFHVGDKLRGSNTLDHFMLGTNGEFVKDIREGLIGWVVKHHANSPDRVAHLVPVTFAPIVNNLCYINPEDLERIAN